MGELTARPLAWHGASRTTFGNIPNAPRAMVDASLNRPARQETHSLAGGRDPSSESGVSAFPSRILAAAGRYRSFSCEIEAVLHAVPRSTVEVDWQTIDQSEIT